MLKLNNRMINISKKPQRCLVSQSTEMRWSHLRQYSFNLWTDCSRIYRWAQPAYFSSSHCCVIEPDVCSITSINIYRPPSEGSVLWVCHTSYIILAGLQDETSLYFKNVSLLMEAVSSIGSSKVANSIPEQRGFPHTVQRHTHLANWHRTGVHWCECRWWLIVSEWGPAINWRLPRVSPRPQNEGQWNWKQENDQRRTWDHQNSRWRGGWLKCTGKG